MFFTQEDFKKIEAWLYQRTVRDSEFPMALPINGSESIPILQDNKNKRIDFNDFVKEVTAAKPSDFYNVTVAFCKDRMSLDEAISLVPEKQKKRGLAITFCNERGNWVIYQFIGDSLNQWESYYCWENIIQEAIKELVFWPDEEDITFVQDGNKNLLKFRNREYNPDEFLGMGMTILRRNYIGSESCAIDDEDHMINLLTQEMINQPNTVYVVEYDFDLNGQTISIPSNSVLWFQGGTINNGSLYLNKTAILGAFEFADMGDCKLFGTFNEGQVMTFSNDSYKKKQGGYFLSTIIDKEKETFTPNPVNPWAYTTVRRQELRWWNGEEWLLLLDATDYNEIMSIIEDLIDKHNAEVSEIFQYFKERCTALETRMTNAENRLTNAETRLDNHDTTLTNHETRISNSETRLTNVEIRATNLEDRATNAEKRLDSHDNTLSNHESRVSELETWRTNTVDPKLKNHEDRITQAESDIDELERKMGDKTVQEQITESINALDSTQTGESAHVTVTVTEEDGKLTKVEVSENDIASKEDLDTLTERLRTFLEDVDLKDTTINKWQEIQNFLEGITDTETLLGLLENVSNNASKATKEVADALAQEIKDRKSGDEYLLGLIKDNSTNITNLQSTVDSHDTEIINLKKRVTTVENKVTDLQITINNLKQIILDTINEYLEVNIIGVTKITVNKSVYTMDSDGNITLPDYPSNVDHSSSSDKVAHKLKFTGASTQEYDGSSEVTVNIPTKSSSSETSDKVANKLKFTGAVEAEYDGSTEVTVNIPTGDSSGGSSTGGSINSPLKVEWDETFEFDGSTEVTIPTPTRVKEAASADTAKTANSATTANTATRASTATTATTATTANKVAHKLTFTGGIEAEFDGSKDVTININRGGIDDGDPDQSYEDLEEQNLRANIYVTLKKGSGVDAEPNRMGITTDGICYYYDAYDKLFSSINRSVTTSNGSTGTLTATGGVFQYDDKVKLPSGNINGGTYKVKAVLILNSHIDGNPIYLYNPSVLDESTEIVYRTVEYIENGKIKITLYLNPKEYSSYLQTNVNLTLLVTYDIEALYPDNSGTDDEGNGELTTFTSDKSIRLGLSFIETHSNADSTVSGIVDDIGQPTISTAEIKLKNISGKVIKSFKVTRENFGYYCNDTNADYAGNGFNFSGITGSFYSKTEKNRTYNMIVDIVYNLENTEAAFNSGLRTTIDSITNTNASGNDDEIIHVNGESELYSSHNWFIKKDITISEDKKSVHLEFYLYITEDSIYHPASTDEYYVNLASNFRINQLVSDTKCRTLTFKSSDDTTSNPNMIDIIKAVSISMAYPNFTPDDENGITTYYTARLKDTKGNTIKTVKGSFDDDKTVTDMNYTKTTFVINSFSEYKSYPKEDGEYLYNLILEIEFYVKDRLGSGDFYHIDINQPSIYNSSGGVPLKQYTSNEIVNYTSEELDDNTVKFTAYLKINIMKYAEYIIIIPSANLSRITTSPTQQELEELIKKILAEQTKE